VFELKGKRVSVGAARSGNELNARALLGIAKISYADLLQVEYLEYGQSVDLLVKGQLDAAIISAGLGVAAVQRAASQVPIDIVPIDAKLIENSNGMFYAISIPADSYPGQKQQVNTAALNNYFVTTIDASEDLVYRITKAIFGNLKEIRAAHTAASGMSSESALAVRPIEVHPGAARYFREAGVLR